MSGAPSCAPLRRVHAASLVLLLAKITVVTSQEGEPRRIRRRVAQVTLDDDGGPIFDQEQAVVVNGDGSISQVQAMDDVPMNAAPKRLSLMRSERGNEVSRGTGEAALLGLRQGTDQAAVSSQSTTAATSATTSTTTTTTTACVWTDWSVWNDCEANATSATTHWGVRERYRSVSPPGATGCNGTAEQTGSCPLPQDCEWGAWSAWGPACPACAGNKQRTRQRAVVAARGGVDCQGHATETAPCNCPVNCQWAEWNHWSTCTKTCGNGTRSRGRSQNQTAQHGGLACSGPAQQSENCNPNACPKDCIMGQWSAWSKCNPQCEEQRVRTVTQQPDPLGQKCPENPFTHENSTCPGCSTCLWGAWDTAWSACSVTCGTGVKTKKRGIAREATGPGANCIGSDTQTAACTMAACPTPAPAPGTTAAPAPAPPAGTTAAPAPAADATTTEAPAG